VPKNTSGISNRKSIRLPDFDYFQPGGYFVTILAKNRKMIFGRLTEGVIELSQTGLIVKKELEKLPCRFSDLELDEYIIMPDHVHFVIILHETEKVFVDNLGKTFQPLKGSLGAIIRSFKSSVSVRVHQTLNMDIDVWQRNYYEEYIEDDAKLDRIREYIQNNPLRGSFGD
jgi:REP element-mobilizing transposase RayT